MIENMQLVKDEKQLSSQRYENANENMFKGEDFTKSMP